MASLGEIKFEGKSGEIYTFDIYDLNSNWNSVSGLYVVTRKEPNQSGGETHYIIYIGETEDLKQRLADHHKQDCFNRNNANSLCFHPESDGKTRLAIESDLLAKWKTSCND